MNKEKMCMLMTTWEEKYRTVLGWKGLEKELNLNQTKQTNQKEGEFQENLKNQNGKFTGF
jgi:phospho-2-dehydro-3-deoxyheptonate aldolase